MESGRGIVDSRMGGSDEGGDWEEEGETSWEEGGPFPPGQGGHAAGTPYGGMYPGEDGSGLKLLRQLVITNL